MPTQWLSWFRYVVVACTLLLASCQTTLIDDAQPNTKPAANSDFAGLLLASDRYETSLKEAPNRIKHDSLNQYITTLVCDLAGEHCPDIRVYILDIPYFNAFMLPNGAMTIWSGLLLRAQSEDELSFVLAHEIGHYVKHHSFKQYRKSKNASKMLAFVYVASPFAGLFSQLAAIGALSKYSRTHEAESDAYAVATLRKHNKNVRSGAQLFRLLLAEEKALKELKQESLFLASHPTTESRISSIENSELGSIKPSNQPDPYRAQVSAFHADWLESELRKRSYLSTEKLLSELSERKGLAPKELHYAYAELYRKRAQEEDLTLAVNHYQQYIESEGKVAPVAYRGLAEVQEKLNNPKLAQRSYQAYLKSAPDAYDADLIKSKLQTLQTQ